LLLLPAGYLLNKGINTSQAIASHLDIVGVTEKVCCPVDLFGTVNALGFIRLVDSMPLLIML
jgi:hypothetical protein